LVFGGAATARADFVIEVSTDNGYFNVIDDNGVFDSNPNAGEITVDTTAFNQDLATGNAGFQITQGLGASTNANGVPTDLATLSINGEVQRVDTPLPVTTITFVTRSSVNPPPDFGYEFPVGGALAMNSSAGGTFLISSAGDQTTFQSTFTDSAAVSTSSTNLVFPAAPSYSGDSPEVLLGSRPLPFDLSSTLTVTLNSVLDKQQFTGITTVRAIPEPGSIALLMVGGAGLVTLSRRRRAAA
jgi:hypothetical protein